MWNGLVVIIRTVTGVTHDHPLLLSKLLLLYGYNTPDNIVLLGCSLWHLWVTAWLARCLWCTGGSSESGYKQETLWWNHCTQQSSQVT